VPSFLIKVTDPRDGADLYCVWSTICDAPTSELMPRLEFEAYYRWRHGEEGPESLPGLMDRVEQTGCSSLVGYTVQGILDYNRAGPREGRLTLKGLCKRFRANPEPVKESR